MNALIVSSTQKSQLTIADIARSAGDYGIALAVSAADALAELEHKDYDLVIVNSASLTRAKEVAERASVCKECGVILIESAQGYENSVRELKKSGITVIPRPLSRVTLLSAVQNVYATSLRLAGLKEENLSLTRKIEDLKIIDRAKIALITRFGYSEDEAHKYIERQAMNLRTTKREVAMNILKTYEI